MEARLTVLEAQQTALQAQNGRLKGDNTDLKAEVESLEQQLLDYVNGQILSHCFTQFKAFMPDNLMKYNSNSTDFFFFNQTKYTRIFRVPRLCRTLGETSFQYIGPVIWNSLPFSVRHVIWNSLTFSVRHAIWNSLPFSVRYTISLSFFKSKLKTRLFCSTS